jgi:hypothetical protein
MKLSLLFNPKYSVLLISIVFFIGCSSSSKSKQNSLNQININKTQDKTEDSISSKKQSIEIEEEEAPMFSNQSIEEEVPLISNQNVIEEEVSMELEEEQEVEFVDQSYEGQIKFVSSDLRKEFPKKDHIRIAKQMNIDIEDIYYGPNSSDVKAIYINTDEELNEEKLKEIQSKIYRILWDFSGDICTFFKSKNQFYAILSSRKEWSKVNTTVYDYKNLRKEFNRIIKDMKIKEGYPLTDKEIYGIYFRPSLLSSKEKSDLSKATLFIITEEADNTFTQYSIYSNKVYMKDPISLTLNPNGIFNKQAHNSTLKVCPYGDLLEHSNKTKFKEKYSGFYMKID